MDATKLLTRPPGLGFETTNKDVEPEPKDEVSPEPHTFQRRRPDRADEPEGATVNNSLDTSQESKECSAPE